MAPQSRRCGWREVCLNRRMPDAPVVGNPLLDFFHSNHDGLMVWKWMHYFDVYHRHFAPLRGRPITMVEFGIYQGGSLAMWRDYFGPQARIVGVDIDPRCAELPVDAEVVIGDQGDPAFLRDLIDRLGPLDLVLDDGGHQMDQQLTTLKECWPGMRPGGLFLTEDLCTSYWDRFGGGLRRGGTFVEHVKTLIDSLHAWHSEDPGTFPIDDYTRTLGGLHVYDGIVVLERADVPEPRHARVGRASIEFGHVAGGLADQAGGASA